MEIKGITLSDKNLALLRQPESGGTKIGAIEIDSDGQVTRIKEVCVGTKENCACEGAWWNEVARPYGKTVVIYSSDVA